MSHAEWPTPRTFPPSGKYTPSTLQPPERNILYYFLVAIALVEVLCLAGYGFNIVDAGAPAELYYSVVYLVSLLTTWKCPSVSIYVIGRLGIFKISKHLKPDDMYKIIKGNETMNGRKSQKFRRLKNCRMGKNTTSYQ